MPNYWLGIMALAFAAALALWIVLVFRAERLPPRPPQESTPHREVIGGTFDAREGGRQVMPHPGAPLVPEAGNDVSRQGGQAAGQEAGHAADRVVPEQRATPEAEQAPARRHPRRRPARRPSAADDQPERHPTG
jgi:hypothetical protein